MTTDCNTLYNKKYRSIYSIYSRRTVSLVFFKGIYSLNFFCMHGSIDWVIRM